MARHDSGVRWSGMSDEPAWTPSAEVEAKCHAAYLIAKEREEARIAAYIEEQLSQQVWEAGREASL